MSELDDTEEKSRRNLVALSSAILTSAWLQPKLADKGKLLGVIDANDIAPVRVWTLATVALCYFVWRYWLSDLRAKAWRRWGDTRDDWAFKIRVEHIQRESLLYWNKGKKPELVSIPAVAAPTTDRMRAVSAIAALVETQTSPAREIYDITLKGPGGTTIEIIRGCNSDQTGSWMRSSRICANVRCAFLSQGTPELFIPLLLFIGALSVCVWELTHV
ncbi:hypothetical protein [Ralstonia solanacearum]|uniref:hypothetical protein n=1 Tax=Ralstonia solanacearum TaxID=305 RepID=UPI0023065025|nr:hypothetical protein [Ralstonia solanacearum]MDB0511066.1 hypothetical protein [Ralstonia solanacearum]